MNLVLEIPFHSRENMGKRMRDAQDECDTASEGAEGARKRPRSCSVETMLLGNDDAESLSAAICMKEAMVHESGAKDKLVDDAEKKLDKSRIIKTKVASSPIGVFGREYASHPRTSDTVAPLARFTYTKPIQLSRLQLRPSSEEVCLGCPNLSKHKVLVPVEYPEVSQKSNKNFVPVYANQREYQLPVWIIIGKTKYRLQLRAKDQPHFVSGSASVVAFYVSFTTTNATTTASPAATKSKDQKASAKSKKNVLPRYVALKICKVFSREHELEGDASPSLNLLADSINSRWKDELLIHEHLSQTFSELEKESPIVRLFGGCLFRAHSSYQICIAMEKINSSLDDMLQKNIPCGPKVLLNLALALQRLHDSGVIYADLKPSNVLVDKESCAVKFSDFDCSCLPISADEEDIDICEDDDFDAEFIGGGGTLKYASPERQRSGSLPTFLDDAWALGIIFMEILVGEKLQQSETQSLCIKAGTGELETYILQKRTANWDEDELDVLLELVCHLLEENPDDRADIDQAVDTLTCLL